MSSKPIAIRKHAILKLHYRCAVAATPRFHELDTTEQWTMLRKQVEDDRSAFGATLLKIMDNGEERQDDVLSALAAAAQFSAPNRPARSVTRQMDC